MRYINARSPVPGPPFILSSRSLVSGLRSILFALALTLACSNASFAAVGDAVVNNSSVATTAFLDIQPSAGAEWLVHHIFHEAEVEIYWYDGTNDILIAAPTGANYEFTGIRVTNSIRLRVKNINGSTKRIGYDAVVTK
jgi:hypothetical protein